MRTMYVDGEALTERCRALMDGSVRYSLGAKPRSLEAEPSDITRIDCSGFVQYIMYHACGTKLRGGSWYQNRWFRDQQFETMTYETAGQAHDNCLYVGYFPKKRGLTAGHIWFVLNGMTIESYSGGTRHGPGRRPWDTRGLVRNVTACYKIGTCHRIVHDELAAMCELVPMQMDAEW